MSGSILVDPSPLIDGNFETKLEFAHLLLKVLWKSCEMLTKKNPDPENLEKSLHMRGKDRNLQSPQSAHDCVKCIITGKSSQILFIWCKFTTGRFRAERVQIRRVITALVTHEDAEGFNVPAT